MKKINWKFGVVSAVAAGLMLASVPGVALAVENNFSEYDNPTINKVWNYGTSPYTDGEEFEFKLMYADTADKVGSNDTAEPTLKVDQDGVVSVGVTDGDSSGSADGSTTLDKLVNEFEFTAPGQYYFTLSEVKGSNPNVDYSKDTYQVRVDVVWATNEDGSPSKTTEIDGMYVFKDGNKAESVTFTNGSTASDDPLTISKKVAGTAANTDDSFTFKITLGSGVEGTYNVVKNGDSIATLSADNNYSVDITLKHDENVTIPGLPVGVEYTVSETETNYTETYSINNASAVEGLTAKGTIADTGNTVAFTNEKGFMPQTGITMNTLPFVGVGVAAAAGAVTLVISRKRRAGEDF